MEQLTAIGAGSLHAEDSDRHVSLAIGAVGVLNGPMPRLDELTSTIGERVASVPRFSHVPRTQPLDPGAPSWVDIGTLTLVQGG